MGRIRSWWNRVTSRFKLAWTYMPENKKMAYKILGLILAALFLANLSPRLLSLGFFIVVGYLMWIILKK